MWLRQAENPRKERFGWAMETAAALLACGAWILGFGALTGLRTAGMLPVMLLAGGYVCILYGLLGVFQRKSWFCPAVLLMLLAVVVIGRQQLWEGFRLFWNRMGEARTAGTGWVLPELEPQLPAAQRDLSLRLFSAVTGGAAALLICLLISSAAPVLAVLLPASLLAGMVWFGREALPVRLLPMLAVSLALLLAGGWKKRHGQALLGSWIVCGIAAGFLLAAAAAPAPEAWAARCSGTVRRLLHAYRYETAYTTLPEGDFTDYEPAPEGAQAALAVTMDFPEAMYLRGFTGCTFEGDRWEPQEPAVLAENRDLLYWLNRNAFHPGAQFEAAAFQTALRRNTVTVQNLGACSRYRYVPFSLCAGDWLQAEDLRTDSVLSDGERVYVCSVLSGGAEAAARVLEELQEDSGADALAYRRAESAYRDFVFRYYLQIPEEAEALLGGWWDAAEAACGASDSLTPEQARDCVRYVLNQCFSDGETELPLDAAAGTAYQYATVAVLTLRRFGIPARYAEGYVISEELASGAAAGETLQVDSSCASAWAEVYQDGIGWIPMAMTPGSGETPEGASGAGEQGDGRQTAGEMQDIPESVEPETPEETPQQEPDTGDSVTIRRSLLRWALLLLSGILLLLLLLIVRRRLLLRRKKRRFRKENCGDAAAWIFADTAELLKVLGLDRGNGSMRALCDPARRRFGEEYAAALQEMIALNEQALFSSRAVGEDGRATALAFRDRTIQKIRDEIKWWKRAWIKWIQCLY